MLEIRIDVKERVNPTHSRYFAIFYHYFEIARDIEFCPAVKLLLRNGADGEN
jgi:hypothetical protein